MSTECATILIVDDDIGIQRALRMTLALRGYRVLLASKGEEALDIAASEQPDLIILDLNLPGMSGIEVCRELRTWSEAPIIILSIRERETDKITALDTGADDYMTKPFNTGELLARIRAHLRRLKQVPSGDSVIKINDLIIDIPAHRVFRGNEEIRLTKTEFDLLQYLARNNGKVITYYILLAEVWGQECDYDTKSLRVHIANLRKKMEIDSDNPQFIITEPGIGYRFVLPGEYS
jgi:two-component system KDP operon response regulator KdpE